MQALPLLDNTAFSLPGGAGHKHWLRVQHIWLFSCAQELQIRQEGMKKLITSFIWVEGLDTGV